jgi:hypothetical protein
VNGDVVDVDVGEDFDPDFSDPIELAKDRPFVLPVVPGVLKAETEIAS